MLHLLARQPRPKAKPAKSEPNNSVVHDGYSWETSIFYFSEKKEKLQTEAACLEVANGFLKAAMVVQHHPSQLQRLDVVLIQQ